MHEQLWSHDAIDRLWAPLGDAEATAAGEVEWLSLGTAAAASGMPVPEILRAVGDERIRWRLLAHEAGEALQLCAQDLLASAGVILR